MIISGVTVQQFYDAVAKAGVAYDGNIEAIIGREYPRQDGTCFRFNARVGLKHTGYQLYGRGDDLAPGQRRSGNAMGGQRRINAVCWHVYRDVLIALFDAHPTVKVKTALAKYYGAQQFQELYPATGRKNIGSLMYPVTMPECCDCWHDDTEPVTIAPAIPDQFQPVDIVDRIDALVNDSLARWQEQN